VLVAHQHEFRPILLLILFVYLLVIFIILFFSKIVGPHILVKTASHLENEEIGVAVPKGEVENADWPLRIAVVDRHQVALNSVQRLV